METSLMSESVVNAGDVEESVTQVLEDHQEEVLVLDVLECFPRVYIHLFVLK